jgi:hypothetical protein
MIAEITTEGNSPNMFDRHERFYSTSMQITEIKLGKSI